MRSKVILEPGQVVNHWTILGPIRTNKFGKIEFLVKCDCERKTEKYVIGTNIKNGRSSSCGCANLDAFIKRSVTHGHARVNQRSRTYICWCEMVQRCCNPNKTGYERYGAVGVKIHQSWMNFETFYQDMGDCPPKHTLDRYPDRHGNYEVGNCRWATQKQQALNQDKTIWLTVDGESLCLEDTARKIGYAGAGAFKRFAKRHDLTLQEAVDKKLQKGVRKFHNVIYNGKITTPRQVCLDLGINAGTPYFIMKAKNCTLQEAVDQLVQKHQTYS